MSFVSVRGLADKASAILRQLGEDGRPVFVTNRGRPVAVMLRLDADKLEDWVLANAPEYVASRAQADAELAAGTTTSLDDLEAE